MSGILNLSTAIGALAHVGASDPVILGGVSLTGMEVPDKLTVGGQQRLGIHNLPGGDKIIDVLGGDNQRLELAGRFIGPTALERAQAVETMRRNGKPIAFSVAGLSWQVLVYDFAYDYTAKGAVIPYRLVLERRDAPSNAAAVTTKGLSELVGTDATNALTAITSGIADVAQQANNVAAQAQNVVGQVTPIANLIGLGGPFAKAQNALQQALTVTQAGTDLGAVPAPVCGMGCGQPYQPGSQERYDGRWRHPGQPDRLCCDAGMEHGEGRFHVPEGSQRISLDQSPRGV